MEKEKFKAIIEELSMTFPELYSIYEGTLEISTGIHDCSEASRVYSRTIEAEEFLKNQNIGSAMLRIKREGELINGIIAKLNLDPYIEPEQFGEVLWKFITYYNSKQ